MSSFEFKSPRLVMRSAVGAESEVSRYADSFVWPLVRDVPEDLEVGTVRELVWRISSGVNLTFSVDDATGCSYVCVAAEVASQCEAFTEHARKHLDVFSVEELLEFHDRADSAEERAGALLMLALGSPQRLDQVTFSRISAGLADEDYDVREAAIYATTYTPALQYIPMLRRIAREDLEDQLRADAQDVLDAYEEAGVVEAE